jgi:hypothetical protein
MLFIPNNIYKILLRAEQIHYYGWHLIFLCEILSNGYARADLELV